ncbi:FtsX-like permease family protein [Nocardiopsis oceani]
MIRLAFRTLRHRKGGFVAAFLTMFLGAAIVMACGGLMESGIRADAPPQQLTGADIVVAGNQGHHVPEFHHTETLTERVRVDAALVDTVAALPGVQDTTDHVFDYPAPEGTVDAIAVVAENGTGVDQLRERIEAALPDTAVTLTGDERGYAENPEVLFTADGLIVLPSLFGSWAIMIAVFGVASMLALSIQQRHRELALLRAVGSTPGQLRKLVLGETVILSALATGLAILPGRWLGELFLHQMVSSGIIIEGIEFRMGWIPMAIAIGSALLAAIGGALVAGARAAKTRPTEALADSGLPERRPIGLWRVLLGLALLAGAIALMVVTMTVFRGLNASTTGSPGMVLMAIALAVLSPVLVRPLAELLRPLGALTGQSGRLAMLNVRAGIDRTAAVAMPVILLTGITTGLVYGHLSGVKAAQEEFIDGLTAEVLITADDGIDPELVERVDALPGVAAASGYVDSTGFLEEPRDDPENWEEETDRWAGWHLEGATADGAEAVVPGAVTQGTLNDLHGAAVALDAGNAAEVGVGLGDPITVRMGDNAVLEAEVVALFDAAADDDTLLLPADVLATHTTEGRVTEMLVAGDGSSSAGRMVADIQEQLAGEDGLTVVDSEAMVAELAWGHDVEFFAIYAIVAMIVGYSAISGVNALASSTNARSREFGLQRLTGSTRGQVLRMLAVEGLLVAVIGVVLGTISAFVTLGAYTVGRADTLYPTGSPLIYIGVVGFAVTLTLLASLVPGWRATRRPPVEAAVAP